MGETYDARLELILKKKGCETLYVVYVFENDKYYRLNESQVCSLMRKGIKIENAKFDIYGIGLLPDDSVSGVRLVKKYEESLAYWCEMNEDWGERLKAEYIDRRVSMDEMSYGSTFKVLWECSNGHKWEATVGHRTYSKCGCTRCDVSGTSYPEQFLYWSFKIGMPELKVSNRIKIRGLEADVYVDSFDGTGLVLEYNGELYHMNKNEHDTIKIGAFMRSGYRVIVIEEIRETVSMDCQKIDDNTIRFSMLYSKKETCLQNLIKYLFNELNISDRISKLNFEKINSLALKHSTGAIEFEKSLAYLYSDLVEKEWDYEKNSIRPENITPGSHKGVWWFCSKCGELYEMTTANKVRGTACKNCGWSFTKKRYIKKSEKKVLDCFPTLIEEFDESKNPGIDLSELCKYADEKITWTCKNCGHDWSTDLINRTSKQTACPVCRYSIFINRFKLGKRGRNSKIKSAYPEMLGEFAEDLNTISKEVLSGLTTGSHEKVVFRCEKCGNAWYTTVAARISGRTGCPKCGWNIFEQRYKGNRRKTIREEFPQLMQEFDEKINDISVTKFLNLTSRSAKRLWWHCVRCGEIWDNTVSNRVGAQSGCKKCGFNIFKAEKTHLGPLFNSDLQKEVLVISDDTGDSIDLEEGWTGEKTQQDLENNHNSNEKDFTDIIELYKCRHKKGEIQ